MTPVSPTTTPEGPRHKPGGEWFKENSLSRWPSVRGSALGASHTGGGATGVSPWGSTIKWLSWRVRITCIIFFFAGSLLPPYIPKAALASQDVSVASPQFLLVEEGFLMKSASLTRQGSRRAYAEGIIHTVKEGESLERLAGRYGIAVSTIRWANDLAWDEVIQPGDELLILPVDGVLHVVSRGQTLTAISQLYGIEQEVIVEQNHLTSSFLLAGQEVIIPGATPIVGEPKVIASAEPPPRGETPRPTQAGGPAEVAKRPEDTPSPQAPVRTPPAPQYTPAPTSGVLQKPCSDSCFITQYYHPGHYALDMQEKGGGQIFAAEAGTVIRSDYGWNGGFGNVIEIDHGNELITRYAHNEELLAEVGQNVARGQYIANMGNSGLVYGTTGIHVHFEVVLRGVKKNPLLYIQ